MPSIPIRYFLAPLYDSGSKQTASHSLLPLLRQDFFWTEGLLKRFPHRIAIPLFFLALEQAHTIRISIR